VKATLIGVSIAQDGLWKVYKGKVMNDTGNELEVSKNDSLS
jgi:hypothetical protein